MEVDPRWRDAAIRLIHARKTQTGATYYQVLEMWMREFEYSSVFRKYLEKQFKKKGMSVE